MYHSIVRRKVLSLFEAINRGDAEPVITGFAPVFEHIFIGDSALGGRRTSLAATREWYGRLYRLMPDIHFDIDRITISGMPWNTLAIAEWHETNSGTDGVRTYATGIHAVRIVWGRMTRLIIAPDTDMAAGTLRRLAAAGVAEPWRQRSKARAAAGRKALPRASGLLHEAVEDLLAACLLELDRELVALD